jgi:TPR repeat protein
MPSPKLYTLSKRFLGARLPAAPSADNHAQQQRCFVCCRGFLPPRSILISNSSDAPCRGNDGFVPFEASTGEQRLSWSSHRCVRCSTPICAEPHPSIVDANRSFARLERHATRRKLRAPERSELRAATATWAKFAYHHHQHHHHNHHQTRRHRRPRPPGGSSESTTASVALAQLNLGFAHHVGFGVARDARVACELTQASAAHGILGAAHYNLGVLRMKGEDNGGGSDDVISASTSSGAATSRGNDDDDDDDRAAVAHFRLAADLDHVPAQHALAMLINAGSRAALDDDLRGGNNNAGTENNGSRRDGASDSSTSASIAIAAAATVSDREQHHRRSQRRNPQHGQSSRSHSASTHDAFSSSSSGSSSSGGSRGSGRGGGNDGNGGAASSEAVKKAATPWRRRRRAISLLLALARRNSREALKDAGRLLATEDPAAALGLWLSAAAMGCPLSCALAAASCQRGIGCPGGRRDLGRACELFNQAAAMGVDSAVAALEELTQQNDARQQEREPAPTTNDRSPETTGNKQQLRVSFAEAEADGGDDVNDDVDNDDKSGGSNREGGRGGNGKKNGRAGDSKKPPVLVVPLHRFGRRCKCTTAPVFLLTPSSIFLGFFFAF